MYDTNDLIKAIKKLGVDAFEATKPVNLVFGKVISVSPIQIQIEQKLILSQEQLILTKNVTNHRVSISLNNINTTSSSVSVSSSHKHTINFETSEEEDHKHKVQGETNTVSSSDSSSHSHNINGSYNITINNALKIGEQVILLRMQSGQKFVVLDRIGD